MIGEHTDCPVRIWTMVVYEGDGHFVSGSHIHGIYASEEAAAAAREAYRHGPSEVFSYVLGPDGRYILLHCDQ